MQNNTTINFSNLDKSTLEKIIAQSKKGKVNSRTFYKAFSFIETENKEIRQFDTVNDVSNFLNECGIDEKEHYKYIFTCVDGESNKLFLLNGWHICNRLFYLVTPISWSTGNKDADGKLQIEVNY